MKAKAKFDPVPSFNPFTVELRFESAGEALAIVSAINHSKVVNGLTPAFANTGDLFCNVRGAVMEGFKGANPSISDANLIRLRNDVFGHLQTALDGGASKLAEALNELTDTKRQVSQLTEDLASSKRDRAAAMQRAWDAEEKARSWEKAWRTVTNTPSPKQPSTNLRTHPMQLKDIKVGDFIRFEDSTGHLVHGFVKYIVPDGTCPSHELEHWLGRKLTYTPYDRVFVWDPVNGGRHTLDMSGIFQAVLLHRPSSDMVDLIDKHAAEIRRLGEWRRADAIRIEALHKTIDAQTKQVHELEAELAKERDILGKVVKERDEKAELIGQLRKTIDDQTDRLRSLSNHFETRLHARINALEATRQASYDKAVKLHDTLYDLAKTLSRKSE